MIVQFFLLVSDATNGDESAKVLKMTSWYDTERHVKFARFFKLVQCFNN
jgi:hypothetical protein